MRRGWKSEAFDTTIRLNGEEVSVTVEYDYLLGDGRTYNLYGGPPVKLTAVVGPYGQIELSPAEENRIINGICQREAA